MCDPSLEGVGKALGRRSLPCNSFVTESEMTRVNPRCRSYTETGDSQSNIITGRVYAGSCVLVSSNSSNLRIFWEVYDLEGKGVESHGGFRSGKKVSHGCHDHSLTEDG